MSQISCPKCATANELQPRVKLLNQNGKELDPSIFRVLMLFIAGVSAVVLIALAFTGALFATAALTCVPVLLLAAIGVAGYQLWAMPKRRRRLYYLCVNPACRNSWSVWLDPAQE